MAAIPIDELWRLDAIESSPVGPEGYFPLTFNVAGIMDGQTRALHLVFSVNALADLIRDLQELHGIQEQAYIAAIASEMDLPEQNGDGDDEQ